MKLDIAHMAGQIQGLQALLLTLMRHHGESEKLAPDARFELAQARARAFQQSAPESTLEGIAAVEDWWLNAIGERRPD